MRPANRVLGAIAMTCGLAAHAPGALAGAIADRYDMHVVLDPERARLAVSGRVTFAAPAAAAESLRWSLGRGLVPSLAVVRSGGALQPVTATVVDSTEDDFVWALASPGPGAIRGMLFRYDVTHPESRTYFDAGPDYYFAEAGPHSWYPRRPDTRASGDVEYEYPSGWTVVAAGVAGSGTTAGARARRRYSATFASELWFAAARFEAYRFAGPVPVTVYRVSPGIHSASLAPQVSRTLDALRRRFGAFPYPALSLIEVPPDVAERAGGFNGLGAAGAVLFGTSFLQPFHLAHVAHELGHQWWGQSLSWRAGSGGDYMLDEAMTEYGALEVVEALAGPAMAEDYRRRDLPRAAGGGNYGAVEYLKLAAAGDDTALCCLPDEPVSYRLARSKGARAWYAISQAVGPARFDRALAGILARRAYQLVTWREFLGDLVRDLGPGTEALCREWFERDGAPRWDVAWTQRGDRLELTVTQSDPAYHVNLEAEVVTTAGPRSHALRLADVVTRAVVTERDTVLEVRLDPHYRVLHATAEYAAEAAAFVPDTRARLLLQAGRRAEAETLLTRALGRIAEPDVHGVTFLAASTLARLAEDRHDWKAAAALAERALDAAVRRPDVLPATYLRLARVSAKLAKWDRVTFAARAALAADAAAGSRAGVGPECERLLAEARQRAPQSR